MEGPKAEKEEDCCTEEEDDCFTEKEEDYNNSNTNDNVFFSVSFLLRSTRPIT